ncbi:hypothetical protein R3X40_25675, partial [Salmonella enterica subsp. enterica serovar Agona]|uniref:hypothetical protein n=1 Tax=Salmonella enterica TaxID=28901 RepID=UPI002A74913F
MANKSVAMDAVWAQKRPVTARYFSNLSDQDGIPLPWRISPLRWMPCGPKNAPLPHVILATFP